MARREIRKRLAINVQCTTTTDMQMVAMSDLSAKGCRITAADMDLEVGQIIVLRPEKLESLAGTVKWTSDQSAGIEFSRPLNPAVVECFCQEHPIERRLIIMERAAYCAAAGSVE